MEQPNHRVETMFLQLPTRWFSLRELVPM